MYIMPGGYKTMEAIQGGDFNVFAPGDICEADAAY